MKRKPELLKKCLSGFASLALITASVPATPVFAEENPENIEQEQTDFSETESLETPSAIFVITDFIDFHKTQDGRFENEETQNKYGDLKVLPGTSLEQIDLPEKLIVDGYWQADGSPSTLELADVDWKLKSDIGEIYSEASPEGTYTFIPDLDAYALTDEEIDGFILADETLELPEISLTVAAQPEPEVTDTSANVDPAIGLPTEPQVEDSFIAEDNLTNNGDISIPDNSDSLADTDAPSDNSDIIIPNDSDIQTNDDVLPTEPSGENIFDGLDDSVLDGSDTNIQIYDDNAAPDTDAAPASDVTPDTDAAPASDVTPSTDVIPDANVTPVDDASPAEVQNADVTLRITDINNNIIYDGTNTVITLIPDTGSSANNIFTIPAISDISCGTDLSALTLTFTGADNSAGTSFTLFELSADGSTTPFSTWDYTSSPNKTFRLTDTADNTYTLSIALTSLAKSAHTPSGTATCAKNDTCSICGSEIADSKVAHTWTPATCTSPKTCSVCGATEGTAAGHAWIAATCTAPKTCSVCGITEGTAAGHTWTPATCTTPKTCSVCGTIEGTANGHTWIAATCTTAKTCSVCKTVEGTPLGHNWSAATCTEPKSCTRCDATEGKALGHDMESNWDTITASTDTAHGQQIRYCSRDCGYSEKRPLNIIGDPNNNRILDLTEGGQYNLNTRITFSASGAAMANTEPIGGDVRYVPLSWNIQGTPGTFMDNFTGAFSISKAGTYTVTVVFQKQIYESDTWKSTDITDTKSVTFTVGTLVQGNLAGTADSIRINPQTGDSTPIIPLAIALVAALAISIGVILYKKKK